MPLQKVKAPRGERGAFGRPEGLGREVGRQAVGEQHIDRTIRAREARHK